MNKEEFIFKEKKGKQLDLFEQFITNYSKSQLAEMLCESLDNWNKLKEYCQNNGFMQNTREYGTLTVVDADELAIYMEKLEKGENNER